ncbi:uncharacterized protein [Argopecten irradians]|uniref:uncharacterized protein n=1 Tax=Argopecten irradians TaxID=31199 RepID=UPI00371EF5E7
MNVRVILEKEDREGNVNQTMPHFLSRSYIQLPDDVDLEHNLNDAFQKMFGSFEEFIRKGSGWVLKRVIKLEIHVANYSPVGGSSFIPTPTTFARDKAIINITNDDDRCFLWSVLAYLHPSPLLPERVSNYTKYENDLDMTGIAYPTPVSQISKFEKQNKISVNVFGCEEKDIFPMYVTKMRETRSHVNLLFLREGEKSHYCLIRDLNTFLSRTKKTKNKSHFCHFCLQGFTRRDLLEEHIKNCSRHDPQHVEMPDDENCQLKFEDFRKQMKAPFVIYADFEAFVQPIDTCERDLNSSSTTKTARFEPCGFGYQVFMPNSLETLSGNLAETNFRQFSKEFSMAEKKLLLRKGVYPYEYIDCEAKFVETELPSRERFYSNLSKSHITEEDYEYAQRVWQDMNIKSIGEYHDLYLKTDVLLLADVFENFRTMCLDYYGLDAAHFYTAPGLAWSSALRMTGIHLELIKDTDMYLFFESGIRGGVSMISNKYAQANNLHIPETYDPEKPTSYIVYTDCNNLYGKAMSEPLPVGEFEWIDDVTQFDVTQISEKAQRGYLLEVDLEYPNSLHDSHTDYPLAPDKKKVSDDELSPTSKRLWRELHPDPRGREKLLHRTPTEKLIPTLENKTKYVCHYRNLQQYLKLGMKLTKIHRILQFKQTPWLEEYIRFNSEKRKFRT